MKKMFDVAEIPAAISTNVTPGAPSVTSTATGCKVVHAEKFNDYSAGSNSGFVDNLARFVVNPGQATTFPWLSTVAQAFEQYRYNKLWFFIVTTQPTTATGVFYYALDYDVVDQAPTTSSIMMTYGDCEETTVWRNGRLEANREMLGSFGPYRYIRSGAMPANVDPKTYDLANFYFTYVGPLTSTVLCEIWVAYEVELLYPQTLMSRQLRLDREGYSLQLLSGASSFTKIAGSPNELGIVLNSSDASNFALFNIPPGIYSLFISFALTAMRVTSFQIRVGSKTFINNNGICFSTFVVQPASLGTVTGYLLPDYSPTTSISLYDFYVSFGQPLDTAIVYLRRVG